MNLSKIDDRLNKLESQNRIVGLPNGQYFRSRDYIIYYVNLQKAEAQADKENREVMLTDLSPEDQLVFEGLSMLEINDHEAAISRYLIEQSKQIVNRNKNRGG
jgi:hypothetical protein